MAPINLQLSDFNWKSKILAWRISPDSRSRYEIKSMTYLLYPAIAAVLISSLLKLYSERYLVAALLIGFSFILWLLIKQIIKTHIVRPYVLLIFLLGITIVITEAVIFDPVTPLISSPIFAVMAFFYLGLTVGAWLSGLLLVSICLLLFVVNPTAENQNASHIVISFTMVSLIACFYELSRSNTHVVGDEVLKNICNIVQENIRNSDFLIRFGGDEFIVVTATTDYKHAQLVVDKISSAIRQFDFRTNFQISASIGIAELEENDSIKSLLARADEALYIAKSKARSDR